MFEGQSDQKKDRYCIFTLDFQRKNCVVRDIFQNQTCIWVHVHWPLHSFSNFLMICLQDTSQNQTLDSTVLSLASWNTVLGILYESQNYLYAFLRLSVLCWKLRHSNLRPVSDSIHKWHRAVTLTVFLLRNNAVALHVTTLSISFNKSHKL